MNLCIVGTGVVGKELSNLLHENRLQINWKNLVFFGSKKSTGQIIKYETESNQKIYTIRHLEKSDDFAEFDVALFCCSSALSRQYAQWAIKQNCFVIDNSSAFRLLQNYPLIIPEINGDLINTQTTKLVANPNCSTILLCMVLHPLNKLANIKQVIVSTYQAASGAGKYGMSELQKQTEESCTGDGTVKTTDFFGRQYIHNLFSHNSNIDGDSGYNEEELKMIFETDRIMGIPVCATCVRVPVFRSHCESVHIQFDKQVSLHDIRQSIQEFNGLKLQDDITNNQFPEPINTEKKWDIEVGRIRYDMIDPTFKTVTLFLSGDQLLKGAALNSYQILDLWGKKKRINIFV